MCQFVSMLSRRLSVGKSVCVRVCVCVCTFISAHFCMHACAYVCVIPTEFCAQQAPQDLFHRVNTYGPVCGEFEPKDRSEFVRSHPHPKFHIIAFLFESIAVDIQ